MNAIQNAKNSAKQATIRMIKENVGNFVRDLQSALSNMQPQQGPGDGDNMQQGPGDDTNRISRCINMLSTIERVLQNRTTQILLRFNPGIGMFINALNRKLPSLKSALGAANNISADIGSFGSDLSGCLDVMDERVQALDERDEIDNVKTILRDFFDCLNNVIERTLDAVAAQAAQVVEGGNPKQKIRYNNRTYVCKYNKNTKQKYITSNNEKLYLSSIRGKYRYVNP